MPTLAQTLNLARNGMWAFDTPAEKLTALLDGANEVDVPPAAGEIGTFVELLKNHWTPGALQQLALDRVIGTHRLYQGYGGGFLQAQAPLPWRHFSRELIALQLVVRIVQCKYIEQKTHQICGPVTFMQGIARRNIEEYVLYVMGLAENRRGDLGTHTVKVKSGSNLLGKRPGVNDVHSIREADYIALASLRESSNLFAYRSAATHTTLEGMTTPASMMQWMRDAGYTNVEDHVHSGWRVHGLRMKADRTNLGRNLMGPHLQKMQQRLANGHTVMLVGSASLAQMAQGKSYGQSALMRVFGGHFMLALSVDVRQDGAAFGLITWGEEIAPNIEIPWSKIASWYQGFICGQP